MIKFLTIIDLSLVPTVVFFGGKFRQKILASPTYRNISSVLFKVRLHMMCATHPNIVQIIEVFANSVQFPHESSPR